MKRDPFRLERGRVREHFVSRFLEREHGSVLAQAGFEKFGRGAARRQKVDWAAGKSGRVAP